LKKAILLEMSHYLPQYGGDTVREERSRLKEGFRWELTHFTNTIKMTNEFYIMSYKKTFYLPILFCV